MGKIMRNKIKIRKIDYLPARQVTFSKRRRGLFKKAGELSVLCESEVAVVIFSATGKLFDYSSTSTKDVIARYKAYTTGAEQLGQHAIDMQVENANLFQLSKALAHKSRQLRQMNGKDLEDLDLAELEELETTVETGLRRVLKTKEEKIMKEIAALRTKGDELLEANNQLKQSVVMLSDKGNTPGLLELDHDLTAVNNNLGVAENDGVQPATNITCSPSDSATNITCNSDLSLDEDSSVNDLSLKLGLP